MAAGVDISLLTAALKRLSKEDLISIIVKKCIEFDSAAGMSQGTFDKLKSMVIQHLSETETPSVYKENEFLNRELEIMKKSVDDLDYTVRLQKERITDLTSKNASSEKPSIDTYSSVLKNSPQRKYKQDSAVLVIKSTDENIKKGEVFKQIRDRVNPVELNMKIDSTKEIKNGLIVRCSNKDSLNILKTNLTKTIGDKFTIREGAKLNPRLKIHHISSNTAKDPDFLKKLIQNNNITCETSEIKVILKQQRSTHVNIIIEVTPAIRRTILAQGRLYVGWESCAVTDNFAIVRCFHCSRYDHVSKDCKEEVTCPTCAGAHDDCNSDSAKCVNCIIHNERSKYKVPINHSVKDPNCFVYKQKLNNLISRINYE